jgi:hypothetical protein
LALIPSLSQNIDTPNRKKLIQKRLFPATFL